jgi:hypothetical protein
MTSIPHCIQALEIYIEHSGARLQRASLPPCVHGRIYRDLITLRADLDPEQELVALIHELAHWLAHRDTRRAMDHTLHEYEAEAVEALVMARLGLRCRSSPTDNLLSASVARVTAVGARICAALEAQSAIDLNTAAGKEIVFEYEQYGMGDFLGLPEAL